MNGYPKNLNSREDYYYVKDNFPRVQWLPDWQYLLDTEKDWFFDHELAEGEEGIVDDTHKIVVEKNTTSGEEITKQMQYILKQNPTCKLLRLGFTVEEVRKVVESD